MKVIYGNQIELDEITISSNSAGEIYVVNFTADLQTVCDNGFVTNNDIELLEGADLEMDSGAGSAFDTIAWRDFDAGTDSAYISYKHSTQIMTFSSDGDIVFSRGSTSATVMTITQDEVYLTGTNDNVVRMQIDQIDLGFGNPGFRFEQDSSGFAGSLSFNTLSAETVWEIPNFDGVVGIEGGYLYVGEHADADIDTSTLTNGAIYYSTDSGKLVWKDSTTSETVHDLY